MIKYKFDEFVSDVRNLGGKIAKFNPDALIAIARGGMTLGHFLAINLDTRNLFALNSIHYNDTQKLDTLQIFNIPDLTNFKRIVIVDDISDSGESMSEILRILREKFPHCEFKIATIFYKKTAILSPDFAVKEANDWIEFFWEVK